MNEFTGPGIQSVINKWWIWICLCIKIHFKHLEIRAGERVKMGYFSPNGPTAATIPAVTKEGVEL